MEKFTSYLVRAAILGIWLGCGVWFFTHASDQALLFALTYLILIIVRVTVREILALKRRNTPSA